MRIELAVAAIALTVSTVSAHDYTPVRVTASTAGATVDLVSFGRAEIAARELAPMQTLHVRFSLATPRGVEAWQVDLRRVELVLPSRERITPRFANGDGLALPHLTVRGAGHAMADLYFPLPANLAGSALAKLDLRWEASRDEATFAQRAILVRADARDPGEPQRLGRFARWWCDPEYPWPLFYHRPGPVKHRPPAALTVRVY